MVEPKTELQKIAIATARREELDTYQRALDIQWLNDRMEDGRMGRCLALIQREADMEKDYQQRTDHAAIVNARAERETKLGMEVAKVRREEACKLLRRHYLWENDPGIKELNKKLTAGYVCRDLKQQILHNEYRRLQEKAEDKLANSILLNGLYNDKEQKERDDKDHLEKTSTLRRELQQQMVNKQRQKQCAYEDSLVEKKMLDEVMRTIADEDQRELQQKRYLTEKSKQEMLMFQKAREAWRQKQKAMVIKEEQQIEEQKKKLADREAAVIAERERKLRIKEEINQRISDKILRDQAVRDERQNIISTLQEQEYLEKNFQDDLSEKSKSERIRSQTKRALTDQMEARKRQEEEQRRIDAEFRKQTELKIKADEQKELDRVAKLKEKGKLYSQELMKQIQDNAERRKRDQIDEEKRAQAVWDYEKSLQKELAEERRQIISSHAPHVLGYLQAGVLQREDLRDVTAGAQRHQHLRHLDIEAMGRTDRPKRHSKCNAQCNILRKY